MYGGVDLNEFFIASHATETVLPPVSVSAQSVPGADGEIFLSRRYGPREISVKMLMQPTCDREDAIASLASVLDSDKPKELVLDEDSCKSYMAVISGETNLDSLWRHGGGEIVFLCPDPFAYGCSHLKEIDGSGTFFVGGNRETMPVVRAVPERCASWQVVNAGTGKFVKVEHQFDGNDELVLDMAAQACTVNGFVADKFVALESDYFSLAPGDATLVATNGTFSVEWRDRWL